MSSTSEQRKIFTTKELADYLSISDRTLLRWRVERVGPPWVKAGHHVRYLKADVDAWLVSQRCAPGE